MDPSAFSDAVESGLKLAKRIYNGKDRSLSPPKPFSIEKSAGSLEPTAPMIYAVIVDPAIVDNPDIPSYQPHVHGRCDPPALIPLQMNEMEMELDVYFNRVFISVKGLWRVHCIMGSRSCDCRLVVPMGEQGSILGVEIDVAGRSYSTQLRKREETVDMGKTTKLEDGFFLRPQIFSLKVPKVDGGSVLSVKIRWSQQLLYEDGQFAISVPFHFPEYVNPSGKRFASSEKIQLNVNTGIANEVVLKTISHPLKEVRRQMGRFGFLYDAQVLSWSSTDFSFSYEVPSNGIFGGLLLQSPSVHDFDQRDMFCLYLYPGKAEIRTVFRKEVIFLLDVSESMQGKTLENVIAAVAATLAKFTPADSFNIIAFNEETFSFSSSLEFAKTETITRATKWMNENCSAVGGTNIMRALNEAMEIFSSPSDCNPQIFLVTDGAVEDERDICNTMKNLLSRKGSKSPHISTFGLGANCNHYFLQMMASIGRGIYDGAFDEDSVDARMRRFFTRCSSSVLTNITIDGFGDLDSLEVFPLQVPDLLSECPVVLSGRYHGSFTQSIKAKGVLPDMTSMTIDLKVQQAKDIPLDKVVAKQQIDLLTAQAWLSESKEVAEKVAKLSFQTGVISEYTRMILLQSGMERTKPVKEKEAKRLGQKKSIDLKDRPITMPSGQTMGFGNVSATKENIPTFGTGIIQYDNVLAKTVREVTGVCDCCCCFCCIKACSKLNDQCVLALTQLCTALSCFACLSCCMDVCCQDGD